MKKNNKGFTLIELLAVIVVLAIIMVIATQQVNSTIKKSRARSYSDSVLSIKKSAKLACAESSLSDIDSYIDKSDDINVEVKDNNVEITISNNAGKGTGKFANMDLEELKKQTSTGVTYTNATEANFYKVTIDDPCSK